MAREKATGKFSRYHATGNNGQKNFRRFHAMALKMSSKPDDFIQTCKFAWQKKQRRKRQSGKSRGRTFLLIDCLL
jgi:hypothetical protein